MPTRITTSRCCIKPWDSPLKAVRHWKAYLTMDPGSAWAAIARRELAKIKEAAILRGPQQR